MELSLGMPGVGFCLRRQGAVPCLRARVTFGPSPKSDQKRRSNLRFENPPAPRTWGLAVLHPARTRQSVDHPKCGIDLLLSPLPLNVQNVELRSGAFQSKSGSAQRNTSFQHFGRTRIRRQAAEGNPKTMGFWRRSFPHFLRGGKKWGRRRQNGNNFAAVGKSGSRWSAKSPCRARGRGIPLLLRIPLTTDKIRVVPPVCPTRCSIGRGPHHFTALRRK